jgi:hypothetical protein
MNATTTDAAETLTLPEAVSVSSKLYSSLPQDLQSILLTSINHPGVADSPSHPYTLDQLYEAVLSSNSAHLLVSFVPLYHSL